MDHSAVPSLLWWLGLLSTWIQSSASFPIGGNCNVQLHLPTYNTTYNNNCSTVFTVQYTWYPINNYSGTQVLYLLNGPISLSQVFVCFLNTYIYVCESLWLVQQYHTIANRFRRSSAPNIYTIIHITTNVALFKKLIDTVYLHLNWVGGS